MAPLPVAFRRDAGCSGPPDVPAHRRYATGPLAGHREKANLVDSPGRQCHTFKQRPTQVARHLFPTSAARTVKFTVLSHAGLLVESGGVSVLIDPWIVGSCYWRSWFNYPEPDRELIDGLTPSWIYLTHAHWDHFHGPSLRRFSRDTPILTPRTPSARIARDLRAMRFTNVREVPHGGSVCLGPHFTLHSFQFDPIASDSIAVIQDAETTLMNANDCKSFGLSLRQITRRFPEIDFVFRSHSNASFFPYCIEQYENWFDDIRTREDYRDDFIAFARTVRPRYAIPFASNHCFLHPETKRFNNTAVRPDWVADHMAATKVDEDDPQCVVMPSGSSWSHESGFQIKPFDYGDEAEYVETLSRRYAGALARQQQREAATAGDFGSFQRYYDAFLKALGWPLRQLLPTVCFAVVEAECQRLWRVDFRARRIEEVAARDPSGLTMTVHALVMNDCCRKRMFSVWTPSKRLGISLGRAKIHQVFLLLNLLDLFEHEQLPLQRLFSRRSLSVWLRRWREPLDLFRAVVMLRLFRRPVKSLYKSRKRR